MRIKPSFLLLFPAFFCASVLHAQYVDWFTDMSGYNAGHTVCDFLTLPVSATTLARGSISSPGAMDASDIPFFIANSGFFDRNKFSATHIEWLMGLRQEHLAAAFPVLDVGTFGAYSQLFTAGAFENSRDINENKSTPSFFEYALGASYAREILFRTLSAGIGVSYVESRLDRESGRTAKADVDVVYRQPWISSRLSVINVGRRLTYYTTPEPLPTQVSASASFIPLLKFDSLRTRFDIEAGIGVQKTTDEPVIFGAGTEMTIVRLIKLRAGYEYAYKIAPSIAGLSAGCGFQINRYGVDAGWKYQSKDLGYVWGITAKANLNEIIHYTAQDYYRAAEKHFAKSRFRMTIYYAEKALKLDPKLWKAHAIIERSEAMIRRREGEEIGIVYAGNIQGQYLPLLRGNHSIGGLARQAAVISMLRAQFPYVLLINTGNNISSGMHPDKAHFADLFYQKTGFSGVSLGKNELDYALTAPDASLSTHFLYAGPGSPGPIAVADGKVVTVDKHKFFITGTIVDPRRAANPDSIGNLASRVNVLLTEPRARECSLRIVIINGAWQNIQTVAQRITGADLIICGGMHQPFTTPMKIGETTVLSAGDSGMYVGKAALRFNDQNKLLSLDNALIPLTGQIAPDSAMDRAVQEICLRTEFEEQGIDIEKLSRGPADGIFAFSTDRGGSRNIFIRLVDTHAGFPLTFGSPTTGEYLFPKLSLPGNAIAYLQRNAGSSSMLLGCMDANGTQKRILSTVPVQEACFSPNGRWIYYSVNDTAAHRSVISRTTTDGAAKEQILRSENGLTKDLAISSDGSTVVFAADPDSFKDWQIFFASSTGERPIVISDKSAYNRRPLCSPDGTYVSYLSDLTNARKNMDLWIYNTKTGQVTQLTRQAYVQSYCWLDDSRGLVYAGGDPLSELTYINLETAERRLLVTVDQRKTFSETNPQPVPWKGSTRIIYNKEFNDGDTQIWWVSPDSGRSELIVNSPGADWVE
jgi:hypothetical protein